MTEGVKNFLQNLGLGKYYDIFSAKGFDLETDIPHLTESDLKETLMVTCPEEREIILYSAQRFKASSEHFVYEWLCRHSLDHYFVSFIQSGLISLDAVSNIQLPNEELYDELEIVLSGHKKRLERAVISLRQEVQRRSVAEKPITHGWWGKPECLPQAKFDFLCVEGTLFARHEPSRRVKIDFMVDSGSDVSTVQEKTLESLNLELVGPVYSCGIHGGNHTNLYRAQLQIGNQQMTVEVIASNYDSLGSRIVRHFRHVIDGNRHIWLKGNYKDPIPAVLPLKVPTTSKQLESKPHVLDVVNDKHSTVAVSSDSSVLSKESNSKILTLKSVSSPSSLSNPGSHTSNGRLLISADVNKDLSNLQMEKSVKLTKIDNTKNGIRVHSSETNLQTKCPNSLESNMIQDVGSKRTLEHSEEEFSNNHETSRHKLIKLDHDVGNTSYNSNTSLPQPSSATNSTGQNPLQPNLSETKVITSQPIPNNTIPSSSLDHNSLLRDTDDDIDHMDSQKIYSKYSSSNSSLQLSPSSLLQSSFNRHLQTSDGQIYSPGKDVEQLSNPETNSHSYHKAANSAIKSNQQIIAQEDIIHINSDEADAGEDDTGVVHITNKNESKVNNGEYGRNFIPGINSSSVTISILDLNEEEYG